jgi:hypothetical protein
MTAPLDEWTEERIAMKRADIRTGDLFDAISRRNVALAARDAEIARLRNPPCSVCAGTGTPLSGPPCICGGSGREVDEMAGLRLEVVRLRAALASVEPEDHRLPNGLIQGSPEDRATWWWCDRCGHHGPCVGTDATGRRLCMGSCGGKTPNPACTFAKQPGVDA